MRGFSKAIIAGNLTRDPELRTTPNGATVCSFSVAVNRNYKDVNGNQKDEVSYIDCSAWGKMGEIVHQYMTKGRSVLVSGRLYQHSWEDKNSGQKRSRIEIVAEDVNFLGGRDDNNGASFSDRNNNSNNASSAPSSNDVPSDIPEGEIDLSEVPF